MTYNDYCCFYRHHSLCPIREHFISHSKYITCFLKKNVNNKHSTNSLSIPILMAQKILKRWKLETVY